MSHFLSPQIGAFVVVSNDLRKIVFELEKYMPAPLIWLGAACIGLYASNRANNAYLKSTNTVAKLPGESARKVVPRNGAIVTCGIYGVLDHTGIWVDGNIYELSGAGLIRTVSPERFLQNRSGDNIYVACDEHFKPLAAKEVAQRCQENLFGLRDYHVLNNNCHQFVLEMLTGERAAITSFTELNEAISALFLSAIHWHQAKVNFR
ncbi:MAG: hypothetical protein ACI9O6_001522 [Glaciecola sp.]